MASAAIDAHGREAGRPAEIPKRGWWEIAKRVKTQIKKDRLSIIAAGVAFYGLLAVFPALVALVALYGLVADPAMVESHAAALASMGPGNRASPSSSGMRP